MVYVKVFLDYLDAIEPLSDAERGRLFTALLTYGRTGEAPQLCGNERFLFPMMRAQMDRDEAEFQEKTEKLSEAGRKSGEARAKQAKHGRAKLNKVQPGSTTLNKEKENDKDNDYDKDTIGAGAPAKRPRFIPPTAWDVQAYCDEHGYRIDAQRFVDYYERQGWRLSNGQPVASWQACVRTWVQRDEERKTAQPGSGNVFADIAREMDGGVCNDPF